MLGNILTVGEQALILFLLMVIGFIMGKTKLLNDEGSKALSNLALYVIVPSTLIKAFQLDLTHETLYSYLSCIAATSVAYVIYFVVTVLLIREKDRSKRSVLVTEAIFSNCNYMGFPLMAALMGANGIFYGSAYCTVSPVLVWTLGVAYISGDWKNLNLKKAIINPGVVSIALGLFVFITGFRFPPLLDTVISDVSSMAIPIPMLAIGYMLSHSDIKSAMRDKNVWICTVLRLIVLPLILLFGMYAAGFRGEPLLGTVIAGATPGAAMIAMLAQRYEQDETLAALTCSFTTLLSIVTMPIIVGLAQTIM